MIAFRHILCPIDFSETSIRALTYATAVATWYEAQLEVLHVVPAFAGDVTTPPSSAGSPPLSLPAVSPNEITDEIRRAMIATGVSSVNARPVVQEGRAHEAIVSRAQEQPADLLVLGTHGRSGFTRLLLGSVTEKVLRTAPCPVLTVPPGASPITGAPPTLKRILCPVDFSPSARKALRYAIDLGRQTNGCLTVLYALEYAEPEESLELSPFDPCYPPSVESRRRRQQVTDHARERLHVLIAEEPTRGCEIDDVVVNDRAYKAILRQATDASADLIVMGAQGSGGLELMLYGSNTQHVVRAATCPVMTVRA
jgi:nucleotide-binding universal stress UspA family protein